VLEALGLPATVFVVTDLLGTAEVPWADRLYLAFARTRATRVDGAPAGLPRSGSGATRPGARRTRGSCGR